MKKFFLLWAPLLALSICILCYITLGTSPWGLWGEFRFVSKIKDQRSLRDADVEELLKDAVEWNSLEKRYYDDRPCPHKGAAAENVILAQSESDNLMYRVNESKPYSGWAKRMYDSGQARSLAPYKNGKLHGLITTWHANGQKFTAYGYRDGERVLTIGAWNRNGETVVPFQDGLFTQWYRNGQKKAEETYKDGKRDGLLTKWHAKGKKTIEMTYKDGKLDGLTTAWHEDGQKAGEVTYKDGKLTSAEYWNSKGEEVDSWGEVGFDPIADHLRREAYRAHWGISDETEEEAFE